MTVMHEDRSLVTEAATMGPVTEAAAGLVVIVLAILGLASVAPQDLAAIAAIVVGAALLLQVANAAGEYVLEAGSGVLPAAAGTELGSALAVGFMAGGVGIVLGILALLGVGTAHLVSAALIVFGGTLLLSAGLTAQMSRARIGVEAGAAQAMTRQAAVVAAGAQALIGLAAAILGILAVLQIEASTLVLIGFLAVGASLLLTSAAIAGAAQSIARR